MRLILLTAIMGIWATEAAAHSPLKQTLPADGATISDMPPEVILNFKGKIRLTRIKVTYEEKYIEDLNLVKRYRLHNAGPMNSSRHSLYLKKSK